jgi:hypothetical protein
MYDIPGNYCINDSRIKNEFKLVTFSNYKKKDVITAFKTSLIKSNCEEAIRWMVELNCSGYNKSIMDCINEIYLKFININNILFYIYFKKQYRQFNKIIKKYPRKEELHIRNLQTIRNLLAELTAICSLSKKNNLFSNNALPKINNNKIFNSNELKKHLLAKDLSNVYKYIYETDSKELKLALNEIIFNLNHPSGSYKECIFWYEWLEKVNTKLKNKDQRFKCRDTTLKVPNEYKNTWVFKIWEILNNVHISDLVSKYINKFFMDYLENFKNSTIRKNKYLIFICFYICKNDNFLTQINQYDHLIIQTVANINKMYYSISKNTPFQNYNFKSLVNHEIVNEIQENHENEIEEENCENSDIVVLNNNIDQEYDIVEEEEAVKKSHSDIKLDYFKLIIPKIKN